MSGNQTNYHTATFKLTEAAPVSFARRAGPIALTFLLGAMSIATIVFPVLVLLEEIKQNQDNEYNNCRTNWFDVWAQQQRKWEPQYITLCQKRADPITLANDILYQFRLAATLINIVGLLSGIHALYVLLAPANRMENFRNAMSRIGQSARHLNQMGFQDLAVLLFMILYMGMVMTAYIFNVLATHNSLHNCHPVQARLQGSAFQCEPGLEDSFMNFVFATSALTIVAAVLGSLGVFNMTEATKALGRKAKSALIWCGAQDLKNAGEQEALLRQAQPAAVESAL